MQTLNISANYKEVQVSLGGAKILESTPSTLLLHGNRPYIITIIASQVNASNFLRG